MSPGPTTRNSGALRVILDAVYTRFNCPEFIDPDPLDRVRRYPDPADREVIGLLAACLAYGRVRSILNSLDRLLPRLGESPSSFLEHASPGDLSRAAEGFQHRWTRAEDVAELLRGIGVVRRSYGSLEACLLEGLEEETADIRPALAHLVTRLRQGGGACRLLADPAGGSACKRLHLFLRWMVRNDAVDPGGWSSVPLSLLIVPLDTHMHRVGHALGFTRRKQADAKTALEITEGFRRVNPEDPVRYDFALTRPGIRDGFDMRSIARDPVAGLRDLL